MVSHIILFQVTLLGMTLGNNIEILNFMCMPCLTFNGYYCHDNPWEVNYNGDKCYEHKIDKLNCEENFFSNDIKNCTGAIMATSGACVKAMDNFFNAPALPLEFEMVLEPRSSCGFSIYGHASILTTEHQFPLMMYHEPKLANEYVNERNISTVVWGGKRDEPGKDCLHTSCENKYYLNDIEQYYFFANWDIDKNRTVTMTINENSAYKMSLLPILIISFTTLIMM